MDKEKKKSRTISFHRVSRWRELYPREKRSHSKVEKEEKKKSHYLLHRVGAGCTREQKCDPYAFLLHRFTQYVTSPGRRI